MKEKERSIVIVSSMALFAMFFGAGNLIFPPTLGNWAQDKYLISILGFLITSVGLVIAAVISTTLMGEHIEDNGKVIGNKFSHTFASLILLAIGPGLAIPRTGATTYELIQITFFENLSPVLFALIFFSIVLFFSFNSTKVVDYIGKILTPLLIIFLILIIFKSFSSPIGPIGENPEAGIFTTSFEEGYQTMDALAALAFAGIIIAGYKEKGITDQESIVRMTIKAGVFAAIGLSLVYGGLLYTGATTSVVLTEELGRVELLLFIVNSLLGNTGNIIITIVIGLACLTTAIGLTTAVAEFFQRLSGNRLSYHKLMIVSTVISAILSVNGVDQIVKISVPVLTFLYPIAVILIVLNIAYRNKEVKNRNIYVGAVTGSVIYSIADTITSSFMDINLNSFGWVFLSIIFAFIFEAINKNKIKNK